MSSQRSFIGRAEREPERPMPRGPIRANVWTTAATIAETRAMRGDRDSEFWSRLAGSLRKASKMP